jgi:putative transposase
MLRAALWAEVVGAATADVELEIIRESVRRDRPIGTLAWTLETAKALNLQYSLRPRGRPRGNEPASKERLPMLPKGPPY